jgi:hypothetical protein
MSAMHRIANIALAFSLAGSVPAAAQTLSRPEPECGEAAAVGGYRACALWVDGTIQAARARARAIWRHNDRFAG